MADLAPRVVAVLLLTLTFAEPQVLAEAVQVADLNSLPVNGDGLDLTPMLAVGGVVCFRGRDAAHGWELWRSEGTAVAGMPFVEHARENLSDAHVSFVVAGAEDLLSAAAKNTSL
jgi:hypothetical protein